jgi:hypothetical protein
MIDEHEPHEIEQIIAKWNSAEAAKAASVADATKKASELADRVQHAIVAAENVLREELQKANEAIKRGGRSEEFRYLADAKPGPETLLSAHLTLSEGPAVLRDYLITVGAPDGKISVRRQSGKIQQTLTNILDVQREDWIKFLSGMYEGSIR